MSFGIPRVVILSWLLAGMAMVRPASGQVDDRSVWSLEQLRAARHTLAAHPRRIIANNDGCDCLYFPKDQEVTVQKFLDLRTTALASTQVGTIAYCTISSGFSFFTHDTRAGTLLTRQGAEYGLLPDTHNIARELVDGGQDCLQAVIGFARDHDLEVFWSMRMNDTHDAAHTPQKPYFLFPPLKADHPEWLVGNWERRTEYGRWSSVDYARPEVRKLAYRYLEEVCTGYDVDGVELDFFRHLCYFKEVAEGGQATRQHCDLMTDLMRQVRAMTEQVGCQRRRPLLVSVRVPDSTEYCRDMGLDIERWLADGLVDVLITTGYFRLNPWQYSVALGHKYNVAVYPCLSDSRVVGETRFRRSALESYRGRALNAWAAGADGVHLFNYFNPRTALWRELGDPATLQGLDKLYFVTVRDGDPTRFLAGGAEYRSEPLLTPSRPAALRSSQPYRVSLLIGDDLPASAARGLTPRATLHLEVPLVRDPQQLFVEFNEHALDLVASQGGWLDYALPTDTIRCGENTLAVTLLDRPALTANWNIDFDGGQLPGLPWQRDPGSARTEARVSGGGLVIADRGTVSGDYLYYRCAWGVDPDAETSVEARVRVTSGHNSIIMANGVSGERLVLTPDRIYLYHHRSLGYDLAATDDFHVYRIVLHGADIQVFVDGQLRINAAGVYGARQGYPRNELAFGAANSNAVGEATWDYVRARTTSACLHDSVVQLRFTQP